MPAGKVDTPSNQSNRLFEPVVQGIPPLALTDSGEFNATPVTVQPIPDVTHGYKTFRNRSTFLFTSSALSFVCGAAISATVIATVQPFIVIVPVAVFGTYSATSYVLGTYFWVKSRKEKNLLIHPVNPRKVSRVIQSGVE